MVLARPALLILEQAARAKEPLSREAAARATGSGVTTADDYLRALAKLGFLETDKRDRRLRYGLTDAGRALVSREPPR